MPHITLIFEDGRAIGLQASSEETIYAAALRNKLKSLGRASPGP